MKLISILSPFTAGRLMAGVFTFLGLMFTLGFIIRSFQIASEGPLVRLELNTDKPHYFFLLGPFNDAKRGWADSQPKSQVVNLDSLSVSHKQSTQAARTAVSSASFRLTSETRVRWLQYAEPNPWKRLGLYYAGASGRTLSLLKVLYYGLGSWLLLRMLLEATVATPFTRTNARRLRHFSLLIIGLFLAQELAYVLVRALIPAFSSPELTQPLSHYVLLNTQGDLPGAIVMITLSLIAFIYQRGVELHQEAELTV